SVRPRESGLLDDGGQRSFAALRMTHPLAVILSAAKDLWRKDGRPGVEVKSNLAFHPNLSASSSRVPATISGRASSVSNRPPERSIHAACIPAFWAPMTSKGFEEISRTFSMALPSLSATCRYTLCVGWYTL